MRFPFGWFMKLDKQGRVDLALRTARFSKLMKSKGIHAQFNLEMCDYEDVKAKMDLSDTYFEIAEFG